jgi:hypothetical protein
MATARVESAGRPAPIKRPPSSTSLPSNVQTINGIPTPHSATGIYNAAAGSTSISPADPKYAEIADRNNTNTGMLGLIPPDTRNPGMDGVDGVDGAPGGGGGDDDWEAQLRLKAQLNDETFAKRLGMLSAPPGGGSTAPAYNPAQAEAARAAAFARAKDMAGQTARASLDSLQGILADRGMTGSAGEAAATADVVQGAQGTIDEFGRAQLLSDLDYAQDMDTRSFDAAEKEKDRQLRMKESLLGLMNTSLY